MTFILNMTIILNFIHFWQMVSKDLGRLIKNFAFILKVLRSGMTQLGEIVKVLAAPF